jgi:hypothetical protein
MNGLNHGRIKARRIMQLGSLFLILDDEVREPNLQLIPLFQRHCRRQPLAVDVSAVRRAEVADYDAFAPHGQLAMPTAETAPRPSSMGNRSMVISRGEASAFWQRSLIFTAGGKRQIGGLEEAGSVRAAAN